MNDTRPAKHNKECTQTQGIIFNINLEKKKIINIVVIIIIINNAINN